MYTTPHYNTTIYWHAQCVTYTSIVLLHQTPQSSINGRLGAIPLRNVSHPASQNKKRSLIATNFCYMKNYVTFFQMFPSKTLTLFPKNISNSKNTFTKLLWYCSANTWPYHRILPSIIGPAKYICDIYTVLHVQISQWWHYIL